MGLSLLEDSSFELGLWPLTDSLGVREVESWLVNVLINYLELYRLLVLVVPDVLNSDVDLTLLKLPGAHILHDYTLVERDRARSRLLLQNHDVALVVFLGTV